MTLKDIIAIVVDKAVAEGLDFNCVVIDEALYSKENIEQVFTLTGTTVNEKVSAKMRPIRILRGNIDGGIHVAYIHDFVMDDIDMDESDIILKDSTPSKPAAKDNDITSIELREPTDDEIAEIDDLMNSIFGGVFGIPYSKSKDNPPEEDEDGPNEGRKWSL